MESEKWPVRPVDDWEGPDEDELAEWLNWMAVLHAPLGWRARDLRTHHRTERQGGFIRAKGLG